MALGASRGHIALMVMGSSLRYTLAGAVVGLGAAWTLARMIGTLLYGVAAHDPLSFSVAPAVLANASPSGGICIR